MGKTQLKIDSVANGSMFDLLATNVTYGLKNLVTSEPEISRPIGSSWNYRLPQATYQGHEAPRISVRGMIDVEAKDADNFSTIKNGVTLGWLGSLSRVGSVAYFFDSVTSFASLGSLSVYITNVDLVKESTYQGSDIGNIINYNMGLVETRV